mmetsp:Transcript_18901/g.26840  ORF Transcript_18901/g.26840 Transcript_18901/m.26840 type:complete len:520 (+) Transcript_18901:25-1584(+)
MKLYSPAIMLPAAFAIFFEHVNGDSVATSLSQFTKVGDGICQDSKNAGYDRVYRPSTPDPEACAAVCLDWININGQGSIVGFDFVYLWIGGCFIFFSDGTLLTGPEDYLYFGGQGPIAKSSGESGYWCYSYNAPVVEPSFSNPEWSIVLKNTSTTLPITMSNDTASSFLNFTTGKHKTRLSIFSSDCSNNVTPPGALSFGLPDISLASASQDVGYLYHFNITALAGSNIYTRASSDSPEAFLAFCARLDLLDNDGQSVSFLTNLVNLTLDTTKLVNFTVDNVAVNETALATTQGNFSFNATIEACICDAEDSSFECLSGVAPVLNAFSFLSICVGITSSTTSSVIIDHVVSFKVAQSGTAAVLDSVIDSAASALTEITRSDNKKLVRIKTQLYSRFFEDVTASNKADRKLKGDGSLLLRLSDGSRHLIRVPRAVLGSESIRVMEQERQRSPKSGVSTSSFAIDNIAISESPETKVDKNGKPNAWIFFLVGGAAAAALLAVLFVIASKKKTATSPHTRNG